MAPLDLGVFPVIVPVVLVITLHWKSGPVVPVAVTAVFATEK